ncbi:hypothetical protein [Nonomuraea gerenzanensis]|nr:hypothetical protein [Nonomuraea gerenzanensis]UBU11793.1 hypothetical protein LCN96_47075 [Nonomuraea gerenzanensis]
MSDNEEWHEERDRKGHAMVPATPRDIMHVRVGSFILVFLFAFAVLGLLTGASVMTGIAVVLAVIVAVDIALAVRRQKHRRGADREAG